MKVKKEDKIVVMVNSDMKDQLNKLATKEGFDDLSAYLRHDWNQKLIQAGVK